MVEQLFKCYTRDNILEGLETGHVIHARARAMLASVSHTLGRGQKRDLFYEFQVKWSLFARQLYLFSNKNHSLDS